MATDLAALLADLEKARRKLQVVRHGLRRELWIWLGVGLAIFGAGLTAYLSGHPDFAIVLGVFGGFVLVLGLLIVGTLDGERSDAVADRVKLSLLPILAREIDPSLGYQDTQGIPQAEFDGTGLYPPADSYIYRDLFQGRVGQTEIRFSTAQAWKHHETTVTERDAQGRTHTRTEVRIEDLFEGLFFSADFNKHFAGRTRLWSNGTPFPDGNEDAPVELESPEFAACFQVRATDQVEARYLLTPAMMERLLQVRAQLGKIDVAFVGGRIAITAPGPFRLFYPDLERPMDTAMVERYRLLLRSVTDTVEALDLNTRIWTKT
jgi:hypothetical protein